MPDSPPAKPAVSGLSSPQQADRKPASARDAERRARALRDNLLKRKSQARARIATGERRENDPRK